MQLKDLHIFYEKSFRILLIKIKSQKATFRINKRINRYLLISISAEKLVLD